MTHADTAHQLVLGDRNASYGNPADDYARTAAVWSGLLIEELKPGVTIPPHKAILMMAALKLCREWHRPKADSVVDAHGYLLCYSWALSGERPTPAINEEREACQRAIEDICTGGRLECPTCHKTQPCLCQHQPVPQ